MRRWLGFVVGLLVLALGFPGVPSYAAATYRYDAVTVARADFHEVVAADGGAAALGDVWVGSVSPSRQARGTSTTPSSRSVATEEGVLVEGAGSGTRTINFKPDAADPNWGLTEAHLDKHLFGSGPGSLSQIDAAGNPDLWRNYIQDLASRPATATLKGGIQDVVGTFPLADGSGTFQFGIRIAPAGNNAWDLVTLLTRQAP